MTVTSGTGAASGRDRSTPSADAAAPVVGEMTTGPPDQATGRSGSTRSRGARDPVPGVEHPGPALWIATAGGVGLGPWAPGTWGALVAVVVFVVLFHKLGLALYGMTVLGVTVVGIWSAGAVEEWFGRPDDGRIVIDEVAGQLIALTPIVVLHGLPLGTVRLPGLEALPGGGIDAWWLLVVTGFVAFRWFDIRKPGPVKWAEERFEGGTGVMADDVVAGLLGAVVVTVPAYVVVVARLHALVQNGASAIGPVMVDLGVRLDALLQLPGAIDGGGLAVARLLLERLSA